MNYQTEKGIQASEIMCLFEEHRRLYDVEVGVVFSLSHMKTKQMTVVMTVGG